MRVTKWVLIGLIGLPAAELAVFMLAVYQFGFLATVLVSLATSLIGLAVLRQTGRDRIARLRSALAGGHVSRFNEGGLFTMLGGLLLLLPGFVTDAIGALLLAPSVQAQIRARIRPVDLARAHGRKRARSGRGSVIDLDPQEWRRIPDKPTARAKRERS